MNHTEDKRESSENLFQHELEEFCKQSFKEPQEGELLKGRIVKVTGDSVIVDIGYKSEGIVPLEEFTTRNGEQNIEIGQEISVLLEKWEDDLGYIVLSKRKADQIEVWDDIVKLYEEGKDVEGTIIKRVKGGFHVDIKGIVAFLPFSQFDLKPPKSPDSLVNQTFNFRIIKYTKKKNNINVIVSRRVILEEERERLRKETLAKIHEGAVLEGTVKNITDYGAFIDLGGVDGLVHLSDLSWGKVRHPGDVVKLGERIKVKVLKYDPESQKISLGLKQTKPDPWQAAKDKYPPGTKIKGRVTNITDYGAFVEVEEGLEGLVHISEMSWTKIKHPSEKLKVGQEVTVMVLHIDPPNKKLSLGLKQVEPNPWEELTKRYEKGSRIKGVVKNITDFGVFVGVEGGVDGLIHISDISWKKIKHPSEVFTPGQEIEAVVLNIDKESKRFSLSTKLLEKNPWELVDERYKPGMIVDGRVSGIADFGAFVEIEEGLEGLVHISELTRGKKKGLPVGVGDRVRVEILNVNPEEKKIGLSIREIFDKEADSEAESDDK